MAYPRLTGLAIGTLFALSVFGLGEAIHFAGANPFIGATE